MLTRAGILEIFGLPDRATFEIEPSQDPYGIWCVQVGHEGDPNQLLRIGFAIRLADTIRNVDPDLAAEIEANIEKARRCAKR